MRIHHLMIRLMETSRRFKARGRAEAAALAITAQAIAAIVAVIGLQP
jgi:hypothetical protein